VAPVLFIDVIKLDFLTYAMTKIDVHESGVLEAFNLVNVSSKDHSLNLTFTDVFLFSFFFYKTTFY